MPSLKLLLQDKLSRVLFNELTIDAVHDVSAHFRRFHLSGPSLRSASCAPGDKLQIMIAAVGTRTYSPFAHDTTRGRIEVLAYVHGATPGAEWVKTARSGTKLRAFGPRSSLPLAKLQGPVVFFGDETSFGTAAALSQARGLASGALFVFECTQPDEARGVLAEAGLTQPALVQRQPAHAHLDAIDTALRTALSQRPGANLVLTGHAQTIQGVRARLKARPLNGATPGQTVKAYWADGKSGLD